MKTSLLLLFTLFPLTLLAAIKPDTLPIGSVAPDFSFPGVDGKTYTLADFDDSDYLVLLFTCNHCPTAQYYEERLKSLVEDYQDRGVALVAISPNDPESVRLDELGWADMGDTLEEMKIRARDHEFNFPYLYAGDHEATSLKFGPTATPHAFLFDRDRKLQYVGAIDDSERVQHVKRRYLRDALDALLDGRTPEIQKTRAVGCSVKWSDKREANRQFLARLAAEPVELEAIDAEGMQALRANPSGKFRLVNFWATWCAPCVTEFPGLVETNRMYRHRDFEMVTVAMNHPKEQDQVHAFLKEKEASNRNYIFGDSRRDPLIDAFNPDWAGVAPYTVLINPEGDVVYEEVGSVDFLELRRTILKALNARKPW
jgi:thiol-disulfide isomerase/thioredoxin